MRAAERSWVPSRPAARQSSVATCTIVTAAGGNIRSTIRAGTGTARPARATRHGNGWRRAADILPVPYFHVVFTLPPEIARIGLANRRILVGILFRTAHETLRTIAADPRHGGRRIGGTSVLHTWDQKLRFHPHLHVVIPNAGIGTVSGAWTTGSTTFLAPVKVLACSDSASSKNWPRHMTRGRSRPPAASPILPARQPFATPFPPPAERTG